MATIFGAVFRAAIGAAARDALTDHTDACCKPNCCPNEVTDRPPCARSADDQCKSGLVPVLARRSLHTLPQLGYAWGQA